MTVVRALLIPAILTFPSACSERPDSVTAETAAFTVRDSAGVEIMESAVPLWGPGEGWTVDPEPVLHVGVADGDPRYQFFRITGVRQLSDGGWVIANGGTELRFLGPDGGFLESHGRAGDGPGEFRSISSIQVLPGDTVLAVDHRSGRLSFWTREGGMASDRPRPSDLPARDLVRVTGDCLVGSQTLSSLPGAGEGPPDHGPTGSLARSTRIILRACPGGSGVDTLVVLPDGETLNTFEITGALPGGQTTSRMTTSQMPLARASSWAHFGSELVTATSDRYSYQLRSADGRLIREVRVLALDLPLTDGLRTELRDRQVAEWRARGATSDALASRARRWEPDVAPDVLPLLGRLHVDALGAVWTEPHYAWADSVFDGLVGLPGPFGGLEKRWLVFDSGGVLQGGVEMPDRLEVHQITADLVVGVWRDELEVPYLRGYLIRKPEAR